MFTLFGGPPPCLGDGIFSFDVVEGEIGERIREYTADFVLDQNSEKTRRGRTLETHQMS